MSRVRPLQCAELGSVRPWAWSLRSGTSVSSGMLAHARHVLIRPTVFEATEDPGCVHPKALERRCTKGLSPSWSGSTRSRHIVTPSEKLRLQWHGSLAETRWCYDSQEFSKWFFYNMFSVIFRKKGVQPTLSKCQPRFFPKLKGKLWTIAWSAFLPRGSFGACSVQGATTVGEKVSTQICGFHVPSLHRIVFCIGELATHGGGVRELYSDITRH